MKYDGCFVAHAQGQNDKSCFTLCFFLIWQCLSKKTNSLVNRKTHQKSPHNCLPCEARFYECRYRPTPLYMLYPSYTLVMKYCWIWNPIKVKTDLQRPYFFCLWDLYVCTGIHQALCFPSNSNLVESVSKVNPHSYKKQPFNVLWYIKYVYCWNVLVLPMSIAVRSNAIFAYRNVWYSI